MNRWFFKFMFCLYIPMLIVACASGNHTPIVPTVTPVTSTRMPATATLAKSTIPSPTLAPPTFSLTFSFGPTPTSVGNGPFNAVAEIDEIFPGSTWTELESAQDGTVWLLTDKGMARVSDSDWTVYLANYEGHVVDIDSTNRVWVVSEAGDSISAWDGTKWTKYSSENGWATLNDPQGFNRAYIDYLGTNIFAELPGQIWLSTPEDVRRFDGVQWKIITPEEMNMATHTKDVSPGPPIFPILEIEAIQSTGEVWVGECDFAPYQLPYEGSGARWFDGKSWQGKSTPVESGCVHSIQEDKAGNIWMAVNYSLWRFTPSTQTWVNFTLTEFSAYSHSYVYSVAISDTGEPWLISQPFCGGGGSCTFPTLYHLMDNVWRPVGVNVSHDILFDFAGHAWFVSGNFVSGNSIYTIVDDIPQLVSNLIVNDWTMDTTGRIWLIGKVGQEDKDSLWLATE